MGIKFSGFNFITGMIKIGITSILSMETTNDQFLASFIGNSATELLSCLSFEKRKTIKDSLEKLPEHIMSVIAEFTMPDECRKNLADNLFTLERLKECAESEDIVESFKAMIVDICKECPDCDIETLQIDEIANAITEKVIFLFLEDKNLSDIVNLFFDRATYDMVLENSRKLNFIIDQITPSSDTGNQEYYNSMFHKQKILWFTTFPYVPVTRYHIAREKEEEMVQNILNCNKIAISGVVGGIGKTELLRLVCKKVIDMRLYRFVGWIHYSGDIQADILDSISPQFINNNDSINSLLSLDFQYGQDMILFVDNVDCNNNDEYLDILSRLTCTVIVTTRNQTYFDFDMIYLNLLSEDVAAKIYLTYSNQTDKSVDYYIERIVELCGYHPLAIELVGKYAKKRKLPSEAVYSELLEHEYNLNGLVGSNWNGNRNELIAMQLSKLYKLSNLSLDKPTVYI